MTIDYSSPSFTAVVYDLGSDPAESGSVIEEPDSISDLKDKPFFFCSSVPLNNIF